MGKKPNKSSRHSRGIRANEVTEIFVGGLQEREQSIRSRHPALVPTLDQLSSGRAVTPVRAPGVNASDYMHLIDMAAQAGVFRMWARQGRVTYDLNDHLAQELYRSTYDKLPGNIFSRLPHINPLVVLPDPWPVQLSSSEGLVRGFFVHGFTEDPESQTFTDREEIDGLGVLMVIDLVNTDTGEIRGQTYLRLRIPTRLAEFTLHQAVQYAGERVEAMYVNPGFEDQMWRLIEDVMKPALSILIYLCCDNRDAVEEPLAKTAKSSRAKQAPSGRDPFWVEVGWRMGPKLHAARRLAGRTTDTPGAPSGVQRAAHQRAGHFHKYRVGPGREGTITRWLMPHWVGLGEIPEDMDPITTVVTVDPQRHDPLRRRGLKTNN